MDRSAATGIPTILPTGCGFRTRGDRPSLIEPITDADSPISKPQPRSYPSHHYCPTHRARSTVPIPLAPQVASVAGRCSNRENRGNGDRAHADLTAGPSAWREEAPGREEQHEERIHHR